MTASRSTKEKVGLGALVTAASIALIQWGVPVLGDASVDRLTAKPPLTIDVETDPAVEFLGDPPWQTYNLFVEATKGSSVPAPPSETCREWFAWGRRLGGHDADRTEAYATLQGRPDTAVVVRRVRAEVLERRPPPEGVGAICRAGGAVGNPRLVDVDLDSDPPVVLLSQAGDDYPSRHQLRLTLNGPETEQLIIRGHTRRCDCSWRLHLDLLVNGEEQEAVIDANGEPFRTVATSSAQHVTWNGKRWSSVSRQEWKRQLPIRWQDQKLAPAYG